MNGAPVCSARSITLQTFCACTSPIEPPNTVKSCDATNTLRPSIVPYPVTIPSPGGRLSAIPKSWARWTANGSVSTNEPASIRMSSRSRAVSLPLSCCFSAAPSPAGRAGRLTAPPELLDPVLDGALLHDGRLLGLGHGLSLEAGARPGPVEPQQPLGGQPAAFQLPAACTMRIVTIAFVRPFGRLVRQLPDGVGPLRVSVGPHLRGLLEQPEVHAGRRDSAVGISPLSRFAMQIARSASPGTGPKRSTAQRILRFMKCWIVSSAVRSASHGPTPRLAATGGATKIAVASASTRAALRMRVRTGSDASRRAQPSSTLPPERQYTP